MDITFVVDLIAVATLRNPPEVAPFILQIEVTPSLPPPFTPHVPPPLILPLPPEPLTLIAPLPSISSLVADKENDVVAEFHQNKWKEYA